MSKLNFWKFMLNNVEKGCLVNQNKASLKVMYSLFVESKTYWLK